MAEILEWVPEHPARNFREALQSVQFFLGTLFGLYPLNRPDRYLYPYYAEDVRAGVLTRDEAQELIDNFLSARFHASIQPGSLRFHRRRSGCPGKSGGKRIDIYVFNGAGAHPHARPQRRAGGKRPDQRRYFLHYSVEILSKGITHPAFYNDSAIVESLMRYGCSREDAVNYIHTTCAEISVVGKTKSHTGPFMVALPKTLKETVRACGRNHLRAAPKRLYRADFHATVEGLFPLCHAHVGSQSQRERTHARVLSGGGLHFPGAQYFRGRRTVQLPATNSGWVFHGGRFP